MESRGEPSFRKTRLTSDYIPRLVPLTLPGRRLMIALSPGRGGFNPHRDWIPFIRRYARIERISLHVIVFACNCGETRGKRARLLSYGLCSRSCSRVGCLKDIRFRQLRVSQMYLAMSVRDRSPVGKENNRSVRSRDRSRMRPIARNATDRVPSFQGPRRSSGCKSETSL